MWRQKVNETKVLVPSQYLVDVSHEIDTEGIANFKDCGGLPLYRSALKEVQRWMEEWENKMSTVEQLAHTEFLLWGVHKEGINV